MAETTRTTPPVTFRNGQPILPAPGSVSVPTEYVPPAAPPVERVTPPLDAPTDLVVTGKTSRSNSGALPTAKSRWRYRIVLTVLIVLALFFGGGLLVWNNPMPYGTDGFWRIAEMRATSIIVMAIVAFCQAMATVSFQTVTNNRIITPSLMGFESLYVAVQTAAVYFLGIAGIVAFTEIGRAHV